MPGKPPCTLLFGGLANSFWLFFYGAVLKIVDSVLRRRGQYIKCGFVLAHCFFAGEQRGKKGILCFNREETAQLYCVKQTIKSRYVIKRLTLFPNMF